ncbi:MAG: glycosyltransferase family 1 protein [Planctomycetes bacterium]|nr:glycosyltransferase family 1 protein [Planctomycetota bacterium]
MQMLPCEAFVLTGCLNNQFSSYQLLTMLNGCLLFSDRFHTASGWGKLFKDGESYVLYENTEDLLELYRYYRRNPEAAARIASNGREIVESFFGLGLDSHPWLLADSPDGLCSQLRSSTNFLECSDREPVRWSSLSQLKEDLAVYQLLNDLCVFYPSIRWVIGDRDSASLIQAVLQQVPRCLVSQILLPNSSLEVSPVVMTRMPSDRELMILGKASAAILLVLLRPDEYSSDGQGMLLDFENRLRAHNILSWEWLGNQVQRNNLGIQLKARLTPNASWPLPTGWQALLIWDVEQLAKITPLY